MPSHSLPKKRPTWKTELSAEGRRHLADMDSGEQVIHTFQEPISLKVLRCILAPELSERRTLLLGSKLGLLSKWRPISIVGKADH